MRLIELCAGSAALTRKMAGKPKIVGYMGAKDRYVDQIAEIWGVPQFESFLLNDPGFWGEIWESYTQGLFPDIADLIESWCNWDARELFDYCKKSRDFGDLCFRASARFCLLASTYGGGEIGGFKGRHKLRPSVDGFIPARANLVDRIRSFGTGDKRIQSSSNCAMQVEVFEGSYVYIDPPYKDLSGYEHHLKRSQVIDIAKRWREKGCAVAISESVPLEGELGNGWQSQQLKNGSGQFRKNAKSSDEFLTFCQIG